MICKKCGTPLKQGCLYCSKCGAEVQIVPDYNILEDDILDSFIGDGDLIKNNTKRQETDSEKAKSPEAKKRSKDIFDSIFHVKRRFSLICTAVILLAAIGFLSAYIGHLKVQNSNSSEYQYEKGMEAYEQGKYADAVEHLSAALNLDSDNVSIAFALIDAWTANEQTDLAENYLKNFINSHSDSKDQYNAYEKLISVYVADGAYDKIEALYASTSDQDILNLLSEYYISPPVLSQTTGTYTDDLKITISDSNGNDIYYTLDGSDPVKNGQTYRNSILFSGEGEYTLRAVCKDDRGIYSDETEANYTISYAAPDDPIVYPPTGVYDAPQSIILDVPDNCTAYYTLDGTTPSKTNGFVYTNPIELASGYCVFQVIYVANNGKESAVVQAAYQINGTE